ncbi:MAG: hypothetical protein OT477_06045 [Chloroflexi bacterium]|nr:hypothetical protein [Chloroflexota bacterium]
MNSDNFNFYHELTKQQNYDLLIPDKNIILVVVQLYQKEQAGEFHREDGMFREEVILECIRIANPTEQRIQHELHNQIVQKLLHYFLWRDEDGRYTLKDYAKELCKLIEGRLHGQFNPTHIEKVFNELIQSLNMVWPDISKSPERFNDWVDMHLKERLPAIREQVEILDKKVDEAVTKIQIKAASPDEDFLDLLQSVDAELDTVTAQVNELDSVFHSSEEIRRKLRELQNHPNQEIFDDKVSEVYSFLSKNGERLRWVRRRIDKVRPRIQRLFSDLRKRDFDLKTERFLSHLLKHSDFVRLCSA